MAKNVSPCYHADEEEYIDMELSSSSSSNLLLLKNPTKSPSKTREFEFQMSLNSQERETTTSPADELFYKGKLLPLHLPPRLQMVQTLLKKETFEEEEEEEDDKHFTFHFTTTTTNTNTSRTPLEYSCNIISSPSESCRVSSELNPDDHFFEWSKELNSDHPKKYYYMYWAAKKLKLIKKSSSLGQKLIMASQAYLKSLFSKSASSSSDDQSCSKSTSCINIVDKEYCLDNYIKVSKNNPFGQIGKGTYPTLANVLNTSNMNEKEKIEDGFNSHRRSFSGAIKRHCGGGTKNKCSSSSSSSSSSSATSSSSSSLSFNSSGFYELQFLKRSSSSASSEIETSIEGAIAHCKQSHKLFNSNGLCSLSDSRISVSGDKERPGFCSI